MLQLATKDKEQETPPSCVGQAAPNSLMISSQYRTRLAVQVEVEVQLEEVAEDVQADALEGALVDRHPQHLAQAVQQAPAKAACERTIMLVGLCLPSDNVLRKRTLVVRSARLQMDGN